jgi:hypothetical protein
LTEVSRKKVELGGGKDEGGGEKNEAEEKSMRNLHMV